VLGYLADGASLGGEITLDKDRALKALAPVTERLGLDPVDAAQGIVRVANAEMVRALRVVSVERGLDPREFALVAFGGAGPLHACALAEELEMPTVLIPQAGGVLSALGLALSEMRADYVQPLLASIDDLDAAGFDDAFETMRARAGTELGADVSFEQSADLRYVGQSFELTVPAEDPQAMTAAFHDAHDRRFGYRMDEEAVETVSVRLTATRPIDLPDLSDTSEGRDAPGEKRAANFDGEWIETPVVQRATIGAGTKVEGPCIIEFAEATAVIRPGWAGSVDEVGTVVVSRV
jgi:N-methylhydantoinase A